MTVACLGITVLDHVYEVASLPPPIGKSPATGSRTVIGGIAANAALAIARLGGTARLISRIGDDPTGTLLRDQLETRSVDCRYLDTRPGPSPSSAVFVDTDGERMLVNHKPATLFADGDVPEDAFRGAGAVMCDLRWPLGAKAALAHARSADIPAVLDFDIAPEAGTESLPRLASHVIYGAEALRRRFGADLDDALTQAAREAPHVAVTCGGRGILWRAGAASGTIAAHRVVARDTLGAGDVFHGAAALALTEGASFVEALHFANAAAAVKVTRPSGPDHLPERNDLIPYLEPAACHPL